MTCMFMCVHVSVPTNVIKRQCGLTTVIRILVCKDFVIKILVCDQVCTVQLYYQ